MVTKTDLMRSFASQSAFSKKRAAQSVLEREFVNMMMMSSLYKLDKLWFERKMAEYLGRVGTICAIV